MLIPTVLLLAMAVYVFDFYLLYLYVHSISAQT